MTEQFHRVDYLRAAAKQLERLDKPVARSVRAAIDALASDQYPVGSIKLAGTDDLFRVRVGDYRVIYTVLEDRVVVLIVRIAHRREVYRTP